MPNACKTHKMMQKQFLQLHLALQAAQLHRGFHSQRARDLHPAHTKTQDGAKHSLFNSILLCRLPSFTEAFTASVPLTRIRDIAHRNDIPHDLKQELKHTI